ncbi:MAG TPA: hypothetical protein VF835_04570, partial [Rhizomicrobium sp.]
TPGVQQAASAAIEQNNGRPAEVEADLPTFLPNAPSEPVWSLSSEAQSAAFEREHTRSEREPERHSLPEFEAEHAEAGVTTREPVENVPEPQRPETPPSPPRRGWWQRPFRDRE